ncbi:hypothetical protein Btru_000088 [Bulinus truncatus]|nr:hypothetical protein Btru_000088 [Bulinus truncatus]
MGREKINLRFKTRTKELHKPNCTRSAQFTDARPDFLRVHVHVQCDVYCGSVSGQSKTCHKVLGLVSVFLSEFVEHLSDIVSNLDQEHFQQLEKSYFQLHHLHHLADATLCNQSLPRDVFLALVGLNWQWVVDKLAYLIPVNMSDNSKLYMVTEELKRYLGGGDLTVKQYTKFWNSFGHPKSYASQMESELASEISGIRSSLSISHVNTLENLQSRVHLLAGTSLVHHMWHIAKLMSDSEQWQLVQEELNQLKQKLTQTQSADQKTSCNATDFRKKYPSKLAALWPFFEHLSILAEMSLSTGASSVNDRDICQDYIISHTPFIVDFTCDSVLNHIWESLACNNYQLWLDWPIEDEQFIAREDCQGPAVFHQATLSKFVMHILTRRSNLASSELLPLHISLGRLEEERQQLSHISRHLWAHSATLANKHYSVNMFEEHLFLTTLNRMLLALGCTALLPMEIIIWQKHLTCLQAEVKEAQQEAITQLQNLFDLHCGGLPENLKSQVLLCFLTFQQFISAEDPERRATAVYTGLAYVGLTLSELLSPKGPVDPVHKSRIKLGHFQQEVQEIQSELEAWCSYLSDTTGRKLAETPEEHYHPRVVKLIQRQQHLQESISKLEKLIAYRPDPVQFSKVSQAILSFMKNTCSHIKVTDLVSKLLLTCDTATSSSCVIEEHVWQDTTSRFIHQLQNTFHCYKDITGPFIQAIQIMKLGIRILAHKADRMVKLRKFGSQQSITSAVENVCSFPTVTSTSPDLLHLAYHLIKHVTSDLMCNLPQTDVIKSRLLVCALFLIRAHSFTSRCINSNVMTTLSNVLDNFTNAWTRQEEQKKLKETEKSALFKYKDECHGDERSDREKEEADFKAAYPTFELAFIDVTGADRLEDVGLENQAHHHVTSEVDPLEGITISEMVKVCSIHRDMMTSLSQAGWLDNDPCNTEQETDLMTSSFMLYQTGAEIVKNVFELLGIPASRYLSLCKESDCILTLPSARLLFPQQHPM